MAMSGSVIGGLVEGLTGCDWLAVTGCDWMTGLRF